MPKQQRRGWSDLQPELLELILQKLAVMDYLRCREVCLSWRTAVDDALRCKRRYPPSPQFPFLLLLHPVSNTPARNNPVNLLNLTQDRRYTIGTEKWEGSFDLVCSVEGWLMFQILFHRQAYIGLHFLNPVSGARFRLPNLPLFPDLDLGRDTFLSRNIFRYSKAVFSSAPDSPEFLVVICVLIKHEDQFKQQLAFCKVTDKAWTIIETAETRAMMLYDFAIRGCKLYACTADVLDFVIVFNVRDPNAITAERLVMLDPKPIRIQVHYELKDGLEHFTDNEVIMLVRDCTCGELLLVLYLNDKIIGPDSGKTLRWTKRFRVFRLDMSGPRWLEVDSLGDRILLLDCTGIRVICATGLDGPGELIGGNCVFFCVRNFLSIDSFPKRDLGVFSLKDKSIRRFPLNSSLQVSGRSLWFTPSPWAWMKLLI